MRMRIGTVAVAVAVAVITPATASHGIMVEPSSPAVRIVHVRLFVAATAADADAATPTAFFGSKMGMVFAIPPISKIPSSAASPATAVGIAVAAVGVDDRSEKCRDGLAPLEVGQKMSPSSSRLVQTDTIGDDDDDDNEGLVRNDVVWAILGWANISYYDIDIV
ncbi:hypothetical protein ACHAXS_004657 [Conticribra weissflogii]